MTVPAFGEPEPYVRVTVTVEVPGQPATAITYPRCRDLSLSHIFGVEEHPIGVGPLLPVSCSVAFTADHDPDTGATHTIERRPVDTAKAPPWPGGWHAEQPAHEGAAGE